MGSYRSISPSQHRRRDTGEVREGGLLLKFYEARDNLPPTHWTHETSGYDVDVNTREMGEKITHRLVFRRRLPAEFGRLPLYVSTEAGLKYIARPARRLDPVLFEVTLAHVKLGMSVWDVGGNVGLFAFAAAAAAGPSGSVLAFEPDIWLCSLLKRSARCVGERAPVEILPVAASSTNGLTGFNIAVRSRATNFIDGFGTTQTGGSRETLLVPTVTLDSVLDHRAAPDFVKIDVEGAEMLVLHGASKVLAHRPTVFCEVARETTSDVTTLFKSLGYRLHDADLPNMPEAPCAPPALLAIPE